MNECTQVARLLEPVRIGRRRRPKHLLSDRGYSTRPIRAWARQHHVHLVVPERSDQLAQRAHRPGRTPTFDRHAYRGRNIVKRVVGWLKRWRRLASRAEKLAACFRAAICFVLATTYAARYFSDTTWCFSRAARSPLPSASRAFINTSSRRAFRLRCNDKPPRDATESK